MNTNEIELLEKIKMFSPEDLVNISRLTEKHMKHNPDPTLTEFFAATVLAVEQTLNERDSELLSHYTERVSDE